MNAEAKVLLRNPSRRKVPNQLASSSLTVALEEVATFITRPANLVQDVQNRIAYMITSQIQKWKNFQKNLNTQN